MRLLTVIGHSFNSIVHHNKPIRGEIVIVFASSVVDNELHGTLITIITKIEQLKQNNYKSTRLKQTRNTDNNYN
jgi:hypothetical protein